RVYFARSFAPGCAARAVQCTAHPFSEVTMSARWLVASLLCVVAVAACSDGDSSDPGAKPPDDNGGSGGGSGPAANGPTYHKDVEPILQDHCQKCHVEGGLAPFALLTYEEARSNSPRLVVETQARRMPPWGAQDTDECKPRLAWNHDERLTQ